MSSVRFIGLDVHAETIAVAVAEPDGTRRGKINCARHRLSTLLLRQGRRPPTGVKAWTHAYLAWVKSAVQFAHAAREATLLDYVHEIDLVG